MFYLDGSLEQVSCPLWNGTVISSCQDELMIYSGYFDWKTGAGCLSSLVRQMLMSRCHSGEGPRSLSWWCIPQAQALSIYRDA